MRSRLDKLREVLVGVPTTMREPVVMDGRVVTPPSWWVDDEDATNASFNAMSQL